MNRLHASAQDPKVLALHCIHKFLLANSLEATSATLETESEVVDDPDRTDIDGNTLLDAIVAWTDKLQSFGTAPALVDNDALEQIRKKPDPVVSQQLNKFDARVNVTMTRFLPDCKSFLVASTDQYLRRLSCEGKEDPQYVFG